MRIVVDRERCIASGNCALASPTVFGQDDVGRVVLLEEEPPEELGSGVREAEMACPAGVIEIR